MNKKTILVPTDFSESALSAAKYACQLASKKSYKLELFHCYTTSTALLDNEDNDDNSSVMKADILIEELKASLQETYPDIEINTKTTTGLLSEVLPKYAIEPHYSLIIMGTTGAGSKKNIIWGSSTSQISSKSTIPVLAIPLGCEKFAFDKIAILSNFKKEELDTIQEFSNLVADISQLDVVHIYEDEWFDQDVKEVSEKWPSEIQKLGLVKNIKTICERTDDANEELDTFIEVINKIINQEDYDVVLVTKTRKSFFKRLFSSSSISKQVALDLRRPTFFDNN